MVTLGKVIGGGMPVGAFGGKAEIMAKLSPEGPVYQAGTLSGNPVAMAAGITAVRKLRSNAKLYSVLETRAKRLMEGFAAAAEKHGIALKTDVRGSMFGFFFNDRPVKNFDDAAASDLERFAKFHAGMLSRGFYFACSQFETGFICTQTTDELIEATISAADDVMGTL
jgi:glutamate-1-semialdehyde 2,1-aminomutase